MASTETEVIEPTEEHPEVIGQPEVPAVEPEEELSPKVKALLSKARVEEKQKLYKEKEDLKKRIKELEQAQATAPPAAEGTPAAAKRERADDLMDRMFARLETIERSIEDKDRKANLRAYRNERIADVRAAGKPIVEALVTGDTEEAIDVAIEIATAEAALIYAEAERSHTANGGRRSTTVIRNAPRRPAEVPPTVSGAGSDDGSSVITRAQLNHWTSQASVRNGTYAKYREEIQAALRDGRIQD